MIASGQVGRFYSMIIFPLSSITQIDAVSNDPSNPAECFTAVFLCFGALTHSVARSG
jgi:hypothetical protein